MDGEALFDGLAGTVCAGSGSRAGGAGCGSALGSEREHGCEVGAALAGDGFKRFRDLDEFDDIQPALAALIFSDEGLRPAESLGNIGLGELPCFPDTGKQLLQSLLPWRAERFRHEDRLFDKAGSSSNPDFGLSHIGIVFGCGNRHVQEGRIMTELDPDVADDVPWSDRITPYDERHFVTYLRLLDAEADGAGWQEVARIVLHRNPKAEPDRTRRCWEVHLRRAKRMTEHGYRRLLTAARDAQNGNGRRP